MNKYVYSIILLIVYPFIIQYIYNNKDGSKSNQICDDNECEKAISLVRSIKNSIIHNGLTETLKHMKQYPHTYEKEGIYIWEKRNDANVILYHKNHELFNLFTYEANQALSKVCPENKCDLNKITLHLNEFADAQNNGFTQYTWYNNNTKEYIGKKSYVEKIQNIYEDNINKTIYISSGFEVKNHTNEIDYANAWIQICSYIIFVVLWYIVNIDKLLNPSDILSNGVFWAIIILKYIKLFYVHKNTIHMQDQEKLNSRLDQIGGILAGLTLSISLFFRAFLNISFDRKIAKQVLLLYTISFIFAILSLMHVPTKHTIQNLQIKYYIKNEFLYLTSIFFILSIISISLYFH